MSNSSEIIEKIISAALKVPGVKVDREHFLRKNLKQVISEFQFKKAIEYGTREAEIPINVVDKIAKECINSRSRIAVSASFVSGLPGGIAGLLGGAAADIIQFYANFFNIAQKLMYLYGFNDIDELDSSQEETLLIMLGAAYGISGVEEAIKILFEEVAKEAAEKTAERAAVKMAAMATEKIAVEQVNKAAVKNMAKRVTTEVGEKVVANNSGKIFIKGIPIFGGIICGGITFFTFKPLAKRLQKKLRENYTF